MYQDLDLSVELDVDLDVDGFLPSPSETTKFKPHSAEATKAKPLNSKNLFLFLVMLEKSNGTSVSWLKMISWDQIITQINTQLI